MGRARYSPKKSNVRNTSRISVFAVGFSFSVGIRAARATAEVREVDDCSRQPDLRMRGSVRRTEAPSPDTT